jgi:hypothetical protein
MNNTRTIALFAALAIVAVVLFPGAGSAATRDGTHVVALSQDHKSSVRADASEQAMDTARPAQPQASVTRDRAEGRAVQD